MARAPSCVLLARVEKADAVYRASGLLPHGFLLNEGGGTGLIGTGWRRLDWRPAPILLFGHKSCEGIGARSVLLR